MVSSWATVCAKTDFARRVGKREMALPHISSPVIERRNVTTEIEVPLDYEALALAEVKKSESVLASAQSELQEFVRENFRVVPGGLIYFSHHKRPWLDAELSRITSQVDKARRKLRAALAVGSQLKK
jgi:hypothetical protein